MDDKEHDGKREDMTITRLLEVMRHSAVLKAQFFRKSGSGIQRPLSDESLKKLNAEMT